ncbi:hypothetical protein LAN15_23865, partial [Mycobacterium tuberculosis]|nr:hypothetical protein [Mycobacterium tuberculosis]
MQIAAGFGLQTCALNNEFDPQAALQAIIDRPGPALIHVRIDARQNVYPMVPPGAANTEMVGESAMQKQGDNVLLLITIREPTG